jgi:hypothetical protein
MLNFNINSARKVTIIIIIMKGIKEVCCSNSGRCMLFGWGVYFLFINFLPSMISVFWSIYDETIFRPMNWINKKVIKIIAVILILCFIEI